MSASIGALDKLLEVTLHEMPIHNVFQLYQTSNKGLSSTQAKKKRETYGLNSVMAPGFKTPSWLCCLMPCVMSSAQMQLYQKTIPEQAYVKRNGKWIKIDSASLVPGDIVHVCATERIPADLRIFEARDCVFNTSAILSSNQPLQCDPSAPSDDYIGSPNMGFLGYLVQSGECTGVVVNIGASTVISELIRENNWPPKPNHE